MRVRSNTLYVPVTTFTETNIDKRKEESGNFGKSDNPDKSFTEIFKRFVGIEEKPKNRNIFFR